MDPLSAAFMTFGVICLLSSWVLLLSVSFKDDFAWGMTTIFLPPLSYLYGFFNLDKAASSLVLALIGWALVFLA